jgi:phosphate acetyltransferase
VPHTLYLVPSGGGVGLTTLALGLVRALDNRGIRVAFFKPIGQPVGHDTGPERSTYFIRRLSALTPATPITLEEAGRMILAHRTDELLERVVRDFHASAGTADVVVVEGLAELRDSLSASDLNLQLVQTLSAQVIMAGSLGRAPVAEFEARLELSANPYGGFGGGRVIGCLVNRVPASLVRDGQGRSTLLSKPELNVIGAVPENSELTAYRTIDIAQHLEAETLHEGEIRTRRVRKVNLLARTVPICCRR